MKQTQLKLLQEEFEEKFQAILDEFCIDKDQEVDQLIALLISKLHNPNDTEKFFKKYDKESQGHTGELGKGTYLGRPIMITFCKNPKWILMTPLGWGVSRPELSKNVVVVTKYKNFEDLKKAENAILKR